MQAIPHKPISWDEGDLLTKAAGLIKIQCDLKGSHRRAIQNPRNTAERHALLMTLASHEKEVTFVNNLIDQAEC